MIHHWPAKKRELRVLSRRLLEMTSMEKFWTGKVAAVFCIKITVRCAFRFALDVAYLSRRNGKSKSWGSVGFPVLFSSRFSLSPSVRFSSPQLLSLLFPPQTRSRSLSASYSPQPPSLLYSVSPSPSTRRQYLSCHSPALRLSWLLVLSCHPSSSLSLSPFKVCSPSLSFSLILFNQIVHDFAHNCAILAQV